MRLANRIEHSNYRFHRDASLCRRSGSRRLVRRAETSCSALRQTMHAARLRSIGCPIAGEGRTGEA
ncbi:hypothetical protein AKJ09_02607 [Labilithrix luteola]|uniref:Uncharacterized protein n=1 Tax=Labilithrix luteola TaxID=1391654 RepID=A0A0K1PQY4_9BACT|nr:hypothetical protein AKJ09_02607 [Labilithrix luteola]